MKNFVYLGLLAISFTCSSASAQFFQWPVDFVDSSLRKQIPRLEVSKSDQTNLESVNRKQTSKTITMSVLQVDSFGEFDIAGNTTVGCALTGRRLEQRSPRPNPQNIFHASSNSYLSKLHAQVQLPRTSGSSRSRRVVPGRRRVCGIT